MSRLAIGVPVTHDSRSFETIVWGNFSEFDFSKIDIKNLKMDLIYQICAICVLACSFLVWICFSELFSRRFYLMCSAENLREIFVETYRF